MATLDDRSLSLVDRTVLNQFTGEEINIRELINMLVDSKHLDIVRVLRERDGPATPSYLNDRTSLSPPSIHRYLDDFTNLGWVKSDDAEYRLTGAGAIALKHTQECLEYVNRDDLAWLSRTKVNYPILQSFGEGPVRPDDLGSDPESPSRNRIRQIRREFESKGWVARTSQPVSEARNRASSRGPYQLTPIGHEVCGAFDNLEDEFFQIIDKCPCLRDIGPECGDLPAHALEGARLEVATRSDQYRLHHANLEAADREFDRCRSFSSFYKRDHIENHRPALKAGKQFEVISPKRSLDSQPEIPLKPLDIKYIVEWLMADNTSWYLYPEELPLGLAVFDEEFILISVKSLHAAGPDMSGAVYSTNDELIEWGLNLFERYRDQSTAPPPERLKTRFEEAIGNLQRTCDEVDIHEVKELIGIFMKSLRE